VNLKQHAARLEEELEATVGQVEAIKHQMELRTRKWYVGGRSSPFLIIYAISMYCMMYCKTST
jgi:hypothetical protein